MRPLLILSLLVLSACEDISRDLGKAMSAAAGIKEEVVVLSDHPVEIGTDPVRFIPPQPLKAFDRSSGLCATLGSGIPLESAPRMDAEFRRLTAGGKVSGSLLLQSGQSIALEEGNQAWALNGRLGGKDELSVCAWLKQPLPSADPVVGLELSGSQSFKALGVYWHTESGMRPKHGS